MRATLAALALPLLLLAGCSGQPLPPDRLDYAGQWESDTVLLVISPEGAVHYRREEGNSKVKIDAPIKAFEGDDFLVGLGPFTTKFVVAKRPHLEDGRWRMTVDGRSLTRTRAFGGVET